MRSITFLIGATLALSACQQKEGLKIESYHGKDYVVELPSSDYESNQAVFERMSVSCDDLDGQVQQLRMQIENANQMPLGKKMEARVSLLSNFVTDVEKAEGCEAVKQTSSNYAQLNQVLERNTNHQLNYFVHNHPLVKQEADKVRQKFGDLYVSREPTKQKWTLENDAWTGYWFPASSIDLLIGGNSPLEKFDRVLKGLRRESGVLREERSFFSSFGNGDAWEGHCHAWAMAAVVYEEPKRPISVGGIRFSVADLKAILTKAAANTATEEYGIRYKGDAETDGTYQDIVPDAFHLLMQENLGRNIPVVVDDTAGPEVWTKPVVSMNSSYKPSTDVPNAVDVTTYLVLRKERSKASEAGMLTQAGMEHNVAPILKYRLYHESTPDARGMYKVVRGEWIDGSEASHPDIVIIPDLSRPASDNTVLNKNLDVVERLLKAAR